MLVETGGKASVLPTATATYQRWSALMKIQFALLCLSLNCLLAATANAQVYAQIDEPFGNRNSDDSRIQNELIAPAGNEQQTTVSRREASDLAREAYPGRVLSIRLDGRRWRVRMDEEGTVFNVFVDTENGEVIRPSE
jgi:uncharacterized membrane protein YkoI